jgi:TonB-dependent starch-binding outer membrane protein SusC
MNSKLLNRCLTFLVLIMLPVAALAQNGRTIKGKVTDSNGNPMPGTNVVIQGTQIGVVTDANGNYQINVENPDNAILEFSFVGFVTEEYPAGNESIIDVTLDEDVTTLDELVVIGYGTVKKRDLTGSVSSIKSSEITKTATNNALQSMQGKIAGLDITKASGESGSEINVDLRGNRSVNASNAPLFLVDGIEYGSTLDINSSDIESIEVLKDASSTAIYGTRGANGVVIITTKKGATSSDKLKVALNTYWSVNSPTDLPKLMDVEQEYRFLAERERYNDEKEAGNTWGSTSLNDYPADEVLSTVVSAPYEKSVYEIYTEGGVDWFDMMLHNGLTQNYELSLSGGSEKTSFSLSLGFMNEEGLLLNDNLKRYNGRIAMDHAITRNLKVGANLLYTLRDWDRRQDDVYSQLIKMHSLAQPYLADGTILDKPSELATSHTNPLLNEVEGYYDNNTISNRLFGNVFLDWELLKGLRFRSVFGIDQNSSRFGEYEDYMCTGNYQSGRGSYFEVENKQGFAFTWENTLNYAFNLNDIHDFQILVGQEAYQNVNEMHSTFGYGLQDHYGKNSFYDLSNISSTGRQIEDTYVKSNLLSYFGRLNYKLSNRYLITASLRADGSSVLAEGNKWGYFPSVAGAWIISEEAFMNSSQLINHLKLRASWGQAGNSAVSPYQTLTALGAEKIYYTFGSTVITGQVPAVLGNPDVTWETTTTWDLGVDVSLLKSRISATVDLYYAKTDDLLLFKGLPATSVYPQVLANVGETENKGIEVTMNFRVIEKKDLRWQADVAFSANRDKIVALASGEERDISNPEQALVVGEPVRAFYNYEADGCWGLDETELAASYGKVPGDIRLVDVNHDTIYNDDDKRLYNKSPKFIASLNTTLTYKQFALSALVYARVGQWIQYDYNTAYKPTEQDGSPDVDFWTPENQGAKFPRPGIASQNDMPALAFENASFLKIREVTLAYTLPHTLTTKMRMSNLRIYASLQNYFTFSNLDNYDPERGGDISNPLSKQMVFGLNVEF